MTSNDDRAARLAAIRERVAAATPGPWGWRGNKDAKQITLFRLRAWGDVVMDFCRWGFQEAMPQFVTDGIIRKPEWVMGPPHHPWEIVGIDHPDAVFIAESRADVDYLLALVDPAPAPDDQLARALRRVSALANGVVWPEEDGIEPGPTGHHWWPVIAGTDIPADVVVDDEGGEYEDAAILADYPLLTAEQVRAAKAYCARHADLFAAKNYLDWMDNGEFGHRDMVEWLREDLRALCDEVRRLRQVAALVERFATETYAGENEEALLISVGSAGWRLMEALEALDAERAKANKGARGGE